MRCLLPALALLLAAPADAAPLDRTDGAEMAFGMSYALDACGDPALGAAYRRAIEAKVAHCPFPDAVKAAFRHKAEATEARAQADIARFHRDHPGTPDRIENLQVSCEEVLHGASTQDLRTRLDRYARGEIGIDQAIPDPCEAGGIQPGP